MNLYIICILFSLTLPSTYANLVNNTACIILGEQYPAQTFWPNTTEYRNETASFWSKTTVLNPYCVYAPQCAQDIARGLSVLRSTHTKFAVRGGGHMTVTGASSIDSGVLIVMTKMRTRALSSDKNIAHIGPGNTWIEVYDWINVYDRAIAGGRYATVGVSGFLLGGGISFWGSQYGWGANNVKNYEIVLADSRIIDVNAWSHPDLFWALKGGSNNFGIVTRFDLKTFPRHQVFAGTVSYESSSVRPVFEALEKWMAPEGGIEDIYSAILPNIFIFPTTGAMSASVFLFRDESMAGSVSNSSLTPSTLSGFMAIPALSNTASERNFTEFINETVVDGIRSGREAFHCTGIKASAEAVRTINETVTNAALSALKGVEGCSVAMSIQPISRSWLQAARDSGGDAIDLDPADGNFIELNMVVQWSNSADDALIARWSRETLHTLDQRAKEKGLHYPFHYINDAAAGDEIFPLYGKGKSLPKMRKIRQRYDPSGIFQYLQPGGFKLGTYSGI